MLKIWNLRETLPEHADEEHPHSMAWHVVLPERDGYWDDDAFEMDEEQRAADWARIVDSGRDDLKVPRLLSFDLAVRRGPLERISYVLPTSRQLGTR